MCAAVLLRRTAARVPRHSLERSRAEQSSTRASLLHAPTMRDATAEESRGSTRLRLQDAALDTQRRQQQYTGSSAAEAEAEAECLRGGCWPLCMLLCAALDERRTQWRTSQCNNLKRPTLTRGLIALSRCRSSPPLFKRRSLAASTAPSAALPLSTAATLHTTPRTLSIPSWAPPSALRAPLAPATAPRMSCACAARCGGLTAKGNPHSSHSATQLPDEYSE